MTDHEWGFRTRALHAGARPDPTTGARAVPIFQTSSYVFEDTTDAADLFALQKYGMIYSRLGNPTVSAFEERMASLDGALGAVAASSGHAAEFLAIATLAEAGDHIVSSSHLYGGTITMFSNTLGRFGIETTFVDPTDVDGFAAAIRPNTKVLFTETIGNPSGAIADIEALADVAHSNGLPLAIDSTFSTPALCRPMEWGADIVVHSATKFIGGHGTSLGGVVTEAGTFDWGSGRFANMTEPVPTYNDLRWWDNFGEYSYLTKLRNDHLRDLGSTLAPMHAFLFLQGWRPSTTEWRAMSRTPGRSPPGSKPTLAWPGSTTQGCPHRRITTWRPNTSRTGQAPCSPSAWPVAELQAPPSSNRWR